MMGGNVPVLTFVIFVDLALLLLGRMQCSVAGMGRVTTLSVLKAKIPRLS